MLIRVIPLQLLLVTLTTRSKFVQGDAATALSLLHDLPSPSTTWVGLSEVFVESGTATVELFVFPGLGRANLTGWTLHTTEAAVTSTPGTNLYDMDVTRLSCVSEGKDSRNVLCLVKNVTLAPSRLTFFTISSPGLLQGSWTALLRSSEDTLVKPRSLPSGFVDLPVLPCNRCSNKFKMVRDRPSSPSKENLCLPVPKVSISEINARDGGGFLEVSSEKGKAFSVALFSEGADNSTYSYVTDNSSASLFLIVNGPPTGAPNTEVPTIAFGSYGFVAVWPVAKVPRKSSEALAEQGHPPVDAVLYYTNGTSDMDAVKKLANKLSWILGRPVPVFAVPAAEVTDSVSICTQTTGIDDPAPAPVFTQPTPGSTNVCPRPVDPRLTINEVNAHVVTSTKEFIELNYTGPFPYSLDQVYVTLVNELGTIYKLINLSGGNMTKPYYVIGNKEGTGAVDKHVDAEHFMHNGPAAVVLFYRSDPSDIQESSKLPPDYSWASAIVYSKTYSAVVWYLLRQLGPRARSAYVEDAGLLPTKDESLSRCSSSTLGGDYLYQLSPVTPGAPNDCSLHSPIHNPVLINEVRMHFLTKGNNNLTFWVELAGPPHASVAGIELVVDVGAQKRGLEEPRVTLNDSIGADGFLVIDLMTAGILSNESRDNLWYSQGISLTYGNLLIDEVIYRKTDRATSKVTSEYISMGAQDIVLGKTLSRCIRGLDRLFATTNYAVTEPTRGSPNGCGQLTNPHLVIGEVKAGEDAYIKIVSSSADSVSFAGYVVVVWEKLTDSAGSGPVQWSASSVFSLDSKQSGSSVTIGLNSSADITALKAFLPNFAGIGLYFSYPFFFSNTSSLGSMDFTKAMLIDSVLYSDTVDDQINSTMAEYLFLEFENQGEVITNFSANEVVCRVTPENAVTLRRNIHAFSVGPPMDGIWWISPDAAARSPSCVYDRNKLYLYPHVAVSKLLILSEVYLHKEAGKSFFELWYQGSFFSPSHLQVTLVIFDKTKTVVASVPVSLSNLTKTAAVHSFLLPLHKPTDPEASASLLSWKDVSAVAVLRGIDNYPVGAKMSAGYGTDLIDAVIFDSTRYVRESLSPSGHPPLIRTPGQTNAYASLQRCYSNERLTSTAFGTAESPTNGSLETRCSDPGVTLRQLCLINTTASENVTFKVESLSVQLASLRNVSGDFLKVEFTKAGVPITGVWKNKFLGSDGTPPQLITPVQLDPGRYTFSISYDKGIGSPTSPKVLFTATLVLNAHGNAQYTNPNVESFPIGKSGSTASCLRVCSSGHSGTISQYKYGLSLSPSDPVPLCLTPTVFINEVNALQSGGIDTHEFVELRGPPGQSVAGLWMCILDQHGKLSEHQALSGEFTEKGFYVIGTKYVAERQTGFRGNITGILPNKQVHGVGLYYANKIAHPDASEGLVDMLLYAAAPYTSPPAPALTPPLIRKQLVRGEVFVEALNHPILGPNATMTRCFCNTTKTQDCFGLSWTPTPGAENSCEDASTLRTVDVCVWGGSFQGGGADKLQMTLDRYVLNQLEATCVACHPTRNIIGKSTITPCGGVVDANRTRLVYNVIGNTQEQVDEIVKLANGWKGNQIETLSFEKQSLPLGNCPESCYPLTTSKPSAAPHPTTTGVIVGLVFAALLSVLFTSLVVVFCLKRMREKKRNQMMARFEATYDDGEEELTMADGTVSFSDPFASSSKSHTYRLL